MKKSTPLWCEDCRFVCFGTGLGKPMLTLNDVNGFKNTTDIHSNHLELRMALPCQISTGKRKYVNPYLDFLGITDQCTACVKRQARPGWTCVCRSSVTPDLVLMPYVLQAMVSVKRLCDFLHEEDVDVAAITHHHDDGLWIEKTVTRGTTHEFYILIFQHDRCQTTWRW